MPHPLEILQRIFRIDPIKIDQVKSLMKEKRMARGSIIEGHNRMLNNTYYIKTGAARAFYIKDGKEHTVSFAFDDEYLLTRAMNGSLTVSFLEESDIIYMPHLAVRTELDDIAEIKNTEALLFFQAAMQQYLRYLEERVYVLQSMSAVERYEWAITRYPRLLECANITQIASFLGLTKETLYRIRAGKYR